MNESEQLLKQAERMQRIEKKYPDLQKRNDRYYSSLVKQDFDEVSIVPSCLCHSCGDYSLCLRIRNRDDDVYADTSGIYIGDYNYGVYSFNTKEEVIQKLVSKDINLKAMKAIEEFVLTQVNEEQEEIADKSRRLEEVKLNWNLS